MLAKKLQIKPLQKVCVLNAPRGFAADGFDFEEKLTKTADVILVFVEWHDDLARQWAKITAALGQDGMLWVAYPKKSSGMKSDLAGMNAWPVYKDSAWQPVASVAINETWSAVRFKFAPELTARREARADEKIFDSDGTLCVDKESRKIFPPKDLAKLFGKNKQADEFFATLSFTNKKEYVLWVIESKRPETRAGRLSKTIEKLLAKKKNPSEK